MTKKNALKKIKGREDPTMNYTECNKKKKKKHVVLLRAQLYGSQNSGHIDIQT